MFVNAPNESNYFMTFAWFGINETGVAASQERHLLADFDNLLLVWLHFKIVFFKWRESINQ